MFFFLFQYTETMDSPEGGVVFDQIPNLSEVTKLQILFSATDASNQELLDKETFLVYMEALGCFPGRMSSGFYFVLEE